MTDGKVTDTTRVRNGSVRLTGKGRAATHTIDIVAGKRHIRLAL